ncbi:MAG: recombinase RecT [Acidobacteriaceae bacterium]
MASHEMVLRPQTFDQLTLFAQMAAKSSMVPKDYLGKPENIMLAVQMGSEIGLAPMQSLQNIAVINGRPAVWGDAMLAIVKAHREFEDVKEVIEGTGDTRVATCQLKRGGQTPVRAKFSVDDAKRAGLWNKTGPWQQYPERMLQMRARGFAIRDAFPDALRGLISAEEASDIPRTPMAAYSGTTTIDAVNEPAAATVNSAPMTGNSAPASADIAENERMENAVRTSLAACADLESVKNLAERWRVTCARKSIDANLRGRVDAMISATLVTKSAGEE